MQFWQARLVDSLLIHCAAQQTHRTVLNSNQPLCLTCLCYNTSKPPHDPTLRYFKDMDRAARLQRLHFLQRPHTIESHHIFEKGHVCIFLSWCLCMRMFHVLTSATVSLSWKRIMAKWATTLCLQNHESLDACILCSVCNVVGLGIVSRLVKKVGLKKVQNMNIDNIGNFWDRRLSVLKYLEMIQTLAFSTLQALFKRWSRFQKNQQPEERTIRMAFIKEGSVLLRLKIKTSINRKVATICYSPIYHNSSSCAQIQRWSAWILSLNSWNVAWGGLLRTHTTRLILIHWYPPRHSRGGEEFHIVLSVAMRVSSAHTRHTKWWKMKKASHESHDLDKVFYIDDALPHAYNTWRHVHIISTRKFNQRRRHFEEWPDQSESRKNKLVTLNVRSQTWRLSLSQPVLPISKQMNLHQNIMFACFFGFWVWGPRLLLSCGWNDDHTYPQADFCLEKHTNQHIICSLGNGLLSST